ncbi:nucleotide pyrophosphatase [Sporolactobacillus sp. KGMB 08714]|uniref:nucleotide pyrophosphatase n=1 Tax=Sporolactobacillus sp. KGMB 08714 TaxID=3064704 RepID=UPI002FBE1CAA
MRQTVRLSIDTLKGIKILKKNYENEFNGLKLNQGYVVSKAYIDTKSSLKDGECWKKIRDEKFPLDDLNGIEKTEESRTTLDLNDDVLKGIDKMKQDLPGSFSVKWVTTGYCIRLIVKAGLLKLRSEQKI